MNGKELANLVEASLKQLGHSSRQETSVFMTHTVLSNLHKLAHV